MIERSLFQPEHEMWRATVRHFVEKEIVPFHAQWEKDGIVPRELWLKAGETGMLCCTVPEEYGGMGLDYLFDVVVFEELWRAGASGPGFLIWLQPTSSRLALKNRGGTGCPKWSAVKQSARWG
jgi:alkylation response protein AidB-like acyl-CoA dehydrogenase